MVTHCWVVTLGYKFESEVASVEAAVACVSRLSRFIRFLLSVREEKHKTTAQEGKSAAGDGQYKVCLLAVNRRNDQLAREVCNALDGVKDRERFRIVVKLEADKLLGVGVNCTIADAPEEAHQPC